MNVFLTVLVAELKEDGPSGYRSPHRPLPTTGYAAELKARALAVIMLISTFPSARG